MKSEEAIGKLSEETKRGLATCKTREEAEEVLADECGSPLDDELLDAIAGGLRLDLFADRHGGLTGGRSQQLPTVLDLIR